MARQKITGAQVTGILTTRAIPYDAAKTGATTIIDTGMKFGTQSIYIYYRCFNVSIASPGTYSKITDVVFSDVFASSSDTLKVADIWVNARYSPSNDLLTNGTDVAALQRLSVKLSTATRNVELWGMFNGATACYGVVGMLVVI